MKKLWNFLLMFPVAVVVATGCQSDEILYSDHEYVMFADTVYTMPVLDKEAIFTVPVAATTTESYDRHYAVEVVNDKSNAIRGFHFDFVDNSNNIVIKAGERVANLVLRGHYSNVAREDSLRLTLRLVEPEAQKWSLYGNETHIDFVKCHPFVMNDFLMIKNNDDEVNMTMYASFPFDTNTNTYSVVGYKKDEYTLMLKDMFGASGSGEIRVMFDDSDPLDLLITVPEQPAFREANYGTVWIRSTAQYPSYFNTFDSFFVLYLEAYVPQVGSFGVYQYIFKCIDTDEAENGNNGAVTRTIAEENSSFSNFKFRKFY